jgi:hypothetical protein
MGSCFDGTAWQGVARAASRTALPAEWPDAADGLLVYVTRRSLGVSLASDRASVSEVRTDAPGMRAIDVLLAGWVREPDGSPTSTGLGSCMIVQIRWACETGCETSRAPLHPSTAVLWRAREACRPGDDVLRLDAPGDLAYVSWAARTGSLCVLRGDEVVPAVVRARVSEEQDRHGLLHGYEVLDPTTGEVLFVPP